MISNNQSMIINRNNFIEWNTYAGHIYQAIIIYNIWIRKYCNLEEFHSKKRLNLLPQKLHYHTYGSSCCQHRYDYLDKNEYSVFSILIKVDNKLTLRGYMPWKMIVRWCLSKVKPTSRNQWSQFTYWIRWIIAFFIWNFHFSKFGGAIFQGIDSFNFHLVILC